MAKNIVVCCDGTSNEYGDCKTNVLKLFSVLPKGDPDQVTFYDPVVDRRDSPQAVQGPSEELQDELENPARPPPLYFRRVDPSRFGGRAH
jgi:hypothetical protein